MSESNEDIERMSRKMKDFLVEEVSRSATRNGRSASLSSEQIDEIKSIIYNIIMTMHISVTLNAGIRDLPEHVVLASLIEAISGWNHRIDKMSGRPDISRN